MAKFKLQIITPESVAYTGEADHVVMTTENGEIDVMPGHEPMMTLLRWGELRIHNNDKVDYFAAGLGMAQVLGDQVNVLTGMAVHEEDIDVGKAEEAIQRAQDALAKKDYASEEAAAELQAVVMRNLAQLKVKRRN